MLGSIVTSCVTCDKLGYTKTGKGIFQVRQVCKNCKGYGTVIDSPCQSCKGSGTVETTRKLKVTVPAGVDMDHQLRLKEKGHEGDRNSGKHGDLYLSINVEEHPNFVRKDSEIHFTKPITIGQAILGGTISVSTLDGVVSVKIPSGTQSGTTRTLKGKGVCPVGSKKRGNFHIHWQVQIPTDITKEQAELMEEFSKDEEIQKPSSKKKPNHILERVPLLEKIFAWK